jgi:hypothetical protein
MWSVKRLREEEGKGGGGGSWEEGRSRSREGQGKKLRGGKASVDRRSVEQHTSIIATRAVD